MRLPLACLLASSLAAPALGQELVVWDRVRVAAHLDDDGRLHVRETQEMEVHPEIDTLDWQVGLGADQSVAGVKIVRIAEDGSEHVLERASEPGPDRYSLGRSWARFGIPQKPSVSRRVYRIEYDLLGAVAPAWDLPAGSAPLDSIDFSLRRPTDRWPEVVAAWREAWPDLKRRYRLDHDVMFPDRGSRRPGVKRLDYELRYDPKWRLLDPSKDMGRATPNADYRVTHTLEYLGTGRPRAVNFRGPTWRLGAIAAVPVVGLLLWLLFMGARTVSWMAGPRADAAFFQAEVASQPPELVRMLFSGSGAPPRLGPFLRRMASQGKLEIDVTPAKRDRDLPRTRLHLLVDRAGLHPTERDLVEALFPEGSDETTSDLVRQRYRDLELSPDDVIRGSFAAHLPSETRRRSALGWLAAVLFVVGLFQVVRDNRAVDATPIILAAGVLGALLATAAPTTLRATPPWPGGLLLLVPLLLATGYVGAAHLVPNTPLVPAAAVGLSAMILSGTLGAVGRLLVRGRRDRLLESLWRARRWAARELARPTPRLLDAWIPYLEALDLGRRVRRWREASIGRPFAGPDLEGPSPGPIGPPFTGNARPLPDPGAGWAAAFYVASEEDEHDEEAEP